MHYRFHVNVFARPARVESGPTIDLRGLSLTALRGPAGQPLACDAYLPVDFEHAVAALQSLPRVDVEPDGFFVIAGETGPQHWHVSGHLFDYNDQLHRVELNGRCPRESFDALLSCFGWPATPLVFGPVEQGVLLAEADFRTWAAQTDDAADGHR
jgi:hypothetical protein